MDEKIMTPEEFYEEMLRLKMEYSDDEELVHINMDGVMLELLRSLGYGAGCDVFDSTSMWYA